MRTNSFQSVNKFPAFYRTRRIINAFTSAWHLSRSLSTSVQSMPLHHTCWKFTLILSSQLRLGLPSGLFASRFPTTALYESSLVPVRATSHAHLIILPITIYIILTITMYIILPITIYIILTITIYIFFLTITIYIILRVTTYIFSQNKIYFLIFNYNLLDSLTRIIYCEKCRS